jgi:hypothetical protein
MTTANRLTQLSNSTDSLQLPFFSRQTCPLSARFYHAQTRRSAALLPQPLDGGNDSRRDLIDRPRSIHFRKTSQSPVVIDDRCGQGYVGAHALCEDFFRVVGSLD